jgi:TolB-like protein
VSDTVIGPDYVPSNVYTNPSPPMKAIRRVAVLPITTYNKDINSEYLRKTYQPIFMSELFKSKRFEVVEATPELLWELNNKKEWQAEEKLPSEFFTKLRDATGCEAVLFTRVTVFKPYPPVSMGLNIKLVECESAKIIWSTDEVFDAGNTRVANSARRYYQNNLSIDKTGADSYVILRTPTQFARYVYYDFLEDCSLVCV